MFVALNSVEISPGILILNANIQKLLEEKQQNQVSIVLRKPICIFEPRCEKTGLRGFRPGPTQTGLYCHRRWLEALNFGFRKEILYYPHSENKDADQLRGYREADLRLCFRICKKPVFSRRGSFGPD